MLSTTRAFCPLPLPLSLALLCTILPCILPCMPPILPLAKPFPNPPYTPPPVLVLLDLCINEPDNIAELAIIGSGGEAIVAGEVVEGIVGADV